MGEIRPEDVVSGCVVLFVGGGFDIVLVESGARHVAHYCFFDADLLQTLLGLAEVVGVHVFVEGGVDVDRGLVAEQGAVCILLFLFTVLLLLLFAVFLLFLSIVCLFSIILLAIADLFLL